jgi:hypothetical protein
MKFRISQFVAKGIKSLVWEGDELVDWVAGGRRFRLDGRVIEPNVRYAFAFDAARNSPSGEFSVIYTRCATKGLVLQRGKVLREINRSFYHAAVYEYPIAMFALADGREVIAHCPDDYCRLEIDDLATGQRLTSAIGREPSDVFHSRLAASPGGTFMLSAGWVWHPFDTVRVFDIGAALRDPKHLDGRGIGLDASAEESSAVFLADDRLLLSVEDPAEDEDGNVLVEAQRELRFFDLPGAELKQSLCPSGKIGTMMAVGSDHILALHSHPRLIDLRSGLVVGEWPDISSGNQVSSILVSSNDLPPTAMDSVNRRCAIANGDVVHVMQFES